MAEVMTLEQVEALALQLPPREQLQLVARIGSRLSAMLPALPLRPEPPTQLDSKREAQLRLAQELLAEVEHIEDDSQGEYDAAADIRRLREERDV